MAATPHSALAAATVVHGELPIITWEGRVVTGAVPVMVTLFHDFNIL